MNMMGDATDDDEHQMNLLVGCIKLQAMMRVNSTSE
jgi:hypothetical protein